MRTVWLLAAGLVAIALAMGAQTVWSAGTSGKTYTKVASVSLSTFDGCNVAAPAGCDFRGTSASQPLAITMKVPAGHTARFVATLSMSADCTAVDASRHCQATVLINGQQLAQLFPVFATASGDSVGPSHWRAASYQWVSDAIYGPGTYTIKPRALPSHADTTFYYSSTQFLVEELQVT